MFSKTFFVAAACGLFTSSVNAHMVITSPVPYGESSLNNSPLEADGSDFPCKQRSGVYDIGTMNKIPVGVPQKLSFKGGATHGGGSCQLSVTMDKEPTKDSKWKVVHSILGGCPNGAPGNMDGSPNYDKNPTFEWTMPKGMPNGDYTLAWTWFNKIGNREMYMNCAPISVSGGADNDDVLKSLPDMFVANIPTTECATYESEDFVFPNPGLYVETAGSALGTKMSGPCTAGQAASGGGSNAAPTYGGGFSPASTPAASPTGYGAGSGGSSSVAASSTAATPTGYGSGTSPSESGASPGIPSVSIPGPKGYAGASPLQTQDAGGDSGMATTYNVVTKTTMATVTASGSAPAVPTGYNSGSNPSTGGDNTSGSESTESSGGRTNDTASSSSGSCSGGAVSCNTPGKVVCIDGSQWGMCDINNCAVPQTLSGGTSCSGGVISKRVAYLAHIKRRLGHHARRSFF